ncbi:MAG: DUF6473 family protein [Pseudomonadota bacterium]
MGIGYQDVDRDVIDYDLWFLSNNSPALRGPRSNLSETDLSNTICCIGAAQTFGRFVEDPYPAQIGRLLQQPALNLGVSGAGPGLYLAQQELMKLLEQAGTVIVQAMSARSVSAGIFETMANNGVLKFLEGPHKDKQMLAQQAYLLLRKDLGEEAYREQVSKAQAQWVNLYKELAQRLTGRRVFLWLSSHKPGDNVRLESSPLGVFPHLVTDEMVSKIAPFFDDIVECVLPQMPAQVLINTHTKVMQDVFDARRFPNRGDETRSFNSYYATPDLHDLATRKLVQCLIKNSRLRRFIRRAMRR